MKKIVILGAGIYQVPLIQTAKRMGLYVIVVSIPGDYPGFALADKCCYLNTTDKEAILKMAREEQISAIVTTGTDVAVATIGYVCEQMGLCGIGYSAASIVTDKALMKEAFLAAGVTTAEFAVVHSLEEAGTAFEKIGAPAMLKIVDKSGSRGITRVDNPKMLEEAYAYALDFTGADHMVLERYIEGVEIGVDAFVQNGEIRLIVPHDKLVFQTGRTGIPMGHICPMENEEPLLLQKLEEETKKVIKGIGLDNCAVNMDVFVTGGNNVYVIEAAGRCGATGIPEVLSGYTGLDYYEMIIKNALGEQTVLPQEKKGLPTASVLVHSETTGILESVSYVIDGTSYVNAGCRQEHTAVELDFMPGDRVHAFENGTHRIGQAVFCAATRSEVLQKVKAFQESLVVKAETER